MKETAELEEKKERAAESKGERDGDREKRVRVMCSVSDPC